MRIRLLLPLMLLFWVVVPSAQAHRPDWTEGAGATAVTNLTTSTAFYRELRSATEVDVYTFTAPAGEPLHAGINIPAIAGLENYHVAVALFGPGLPQDVGLWVLPAEAPEGLGVVVFPSETGADFFEPFTQTNYWGRQRLELKLPAAGTYYLVVWNPTGALGKYVLDVGTEEVFGLADLFQFPLWWVRVHDFFGHTPYLLLASGLGVGALWLSLKLSAKPPRRSRL